MTEATVIQKLDLLQPKLVDRFKRIFNNHELAHAYLFAGASGTGKFQLAQWIAMRLFCLNVVENTPDETCEECQRILSGNHPDVVVVEPDGRQIKVEQIRYLKAEFSKSAVEGNVKVFIIQQADRMTTSAANSLLKFLEEPDGDFFAFLLTENKSAILPTIQSRAQSVEFQPLKRAQLIKDFQTQGLSLAQAKFVSGLTNSSTDLIEWQEDDWLSKAEQSVVTWYQQLTQIDLQSFVSVQAKMEPLAKVNRDRAKVILDMITLIWRDTLIYASQHDDDAINYQSGAEQIKRVSEQFSSWQITKIAELTLELRQKMDQNISFQNVVEQLTLKILDVLRG